MAYKRTGAVCRQGVGGKKKMRQNAKKQPKNTKTQKKVPAHLRMSNIFCNFARFLVAEPR